MGAVQGKVLIQIGDGEPVEVGNITIPIKAVLTPDHADLTA